jgi:hypothetical protein
MVEDLCDKTVCNFELPHAPTLILGNIDRRLSRISSNIISIPQAPEFGEIPNVNKRLAKTAGSG